MQYTPGPTGANFLADRSFLKLIMGPIGSGKSTVCLADLFTRACFQQPFNGVRRTKFIILRNTMAQLKDTVKPLITQWFVTLPAAPLGQWRLSDNTFEIRANLPDRTVLHTEFCLLAADTPDDVRRLLSLEASAAWVEEAREVDKDVFEGLQGRVARFPNRAAGGVTYPGVICSTNPPPMESFWQQLVSKPPKNMAVFIQPPALLDDGSLNPDAENLGNLDPQYYPNLLEGKTEGWIDVYLKNKFGAGGFGMPVFKSTFRRPFHVSPTPLKAIPGSSNPLIVGMDNGLTAAAVVMQMDARGRVNILGECYVPEGETMGVETFLDRMLVPYLTSNFTAHPSSIRFILDPACFQRAQLDERTIAMAVAARGYQTQPASTNDPERRIAAVEGLLMRAIDGGPGLLISSTCPWLASALDWGYRNKKQANGVTTAVPEKNHYSHVCFTGDTPVAVPGGERAIADIRAGDMVLTPFGPRRVLAAAMTSENAEVIRVSFGNGRAFECTPEHPVFVAGVGFVRADALQYTNALVQLETSWADRESTSRSSSRGSSTTESQVGTTRRIMRWVASICTALSTSGRTVLSRLGVASTTSTTIAATTRSKTWNCWVLRIMRACICASALARAPSCSVDTSNKPEKQPRRGTPATPDVLFMHGSRESSGSEPNRGGSRAWSAAVRSQLLRALSNGASAAPAVSRALDELPAKTMWNGPVLRAVLASGQTGTARLRVVPGHAAVSSQRASAPVFALQVEGAPMYFAAGVLVSNCDALQYACLHYNIQGRPAGVVQRAAVKVTPARFVYV